jgi:hypothetical protein
MHVKLKPVLVHAATVRFSDWTELRVFAKL